MSRLAILSFINLLLIVGTGAWRKRNSGDIVTPGCDATLTLTDGVGTITSPNFPMAYGSNSNCSWLIQVDPEERIKISFLQFELEKFSDDCSFDSLEIYEKPLKSLIGRYCDDEMPPDILSKSNEIFIHFKSDDSVEYKGFKLTYHTITAGSDATLRLTEDVGTITSPNYPMDYGSNTNCSWLIHVDPKDRIKISFLDFKLEPGDYCNYDSLEIYEKRSTSLIGRYCDDEMPPDILSNSNEIFIRFKSDDSVQFKGFKLTYHTVAPGCEATLTLTENVGTITSPNYPMDYGNNADCSWLIQVDPEDRIEISFLDFQLEPGRDCGFDSLEIYENKLKSLIGRYCDDILPPDIQSYSNEIFIRFKSDYSGGYSGFKLTYHTIKATESLENNSLEDALEEIAGMDP